MSLKSFVINLLAKRVRKSILNMSQNAVRDQKLIFETLIRKAGKTKFGEDHGFNLIKNHMEFCTKVPVRSYEELKPYIHHIINGEKNVLWPGTPKYFAKTSGTTSGIKYIPISNDSIKYHIKAARNTILNYTAISGVDVFTKKMIFLSGSPALEKKGGINTGRLSGIVNHEIPAWVRPNKMPSDATNCIEDWEIKLDKIVEETLDKDMSLISGIPPWVQMYYEKLLEKTGKKTVKEIFPNFRLFVHGGVNYTPYKNVLEQLAGSDVDTLETYPASEGFIAFQDNPQDEGLLLNTNAMMFFEFIPLEEIHNDHPSRLLLSQVKLDHDYVIIVSSNAGLWAYNIGDTIRFTSLDPYKVIVSGRVKHFISAFGEHVIAKEVEEAMSIVSSMHNIKITEFTVAPNISPSDQSLPHHEWFVEFDSIPYNMSLIEQALDKEMTRQNIYYKDLIDGRVLSKLKITVLEKDAFRSYMKAEGKLGGQNKVPRLTNDRKIADKLKNYAVG